MYSLLQLMLALACIGVLLFIAMAAIQLIAVFIVSVVWGIASLVKLAFRRRS